MSTAAAVDEGRVVAKPDRIEQLDDVKLWIADHDARIEELWKQQHVLNERNDKCVNELRSRMTAIEKRIMWLSGVAAVVGAFLGALVPHLIAG